jgi:hypothetical protein
MGIFADGNSQNHTFFKYSNRKNLLFLFSGLIFLIVAYFYYVSAYRKGAGVDILWRVKETKYFLMGINPFDVLVGNVPINPDIGLPAAYAYVSYIAAIPFSFLSEKISILLLYSKIDILCLYAGIFLYRKIMGNKYSILDPLIILITLSSLVILEHINCLNYGVVSIFGLISTAYGITCKSLRYVLIGIFLVSLKPSLLLPLAIALCLSKNFKALCILIFINVLAISIVSLSVDTPIFTLSKQLQQTQYYFSDKGFYRWEGFFLFARDIIGRQITIVGIFCTTILCFFYRKKINNDPIILITLVIISSLCFFYNQEHAWAMAYPLIAYCFYNITNNKQVMFPLVFLILFMCVPSMYIYFESLGFDRYMALHNIIRFGSLFIAGLWIVRIRLKVQQSNVIKDKPANH